MAFQTGTINNSHELVDKLYGFLLSIGWQAISTLQTNASGDGYDYVFKSRSENNDKDVFIRFGAGMTDAARTNVGDFQQPFSDGYNGWVNGLAYQHYTTGGTNPSEDGLNELGVYGPVLYVESNDDVIDEVNLWTATTTSFHVRELASSNISTQTLGVSGFDGHRFIYASDGSAEIRRLDLGTLSESGDLVSTAQNTPSCNGVLIRLADDTLKWYAMTESSQDGRHIDSWTAGSSAWDYVNPFKLYEDPPDWPNPTGQSFDRTFGFFAPAIQRNKTFQDGTDHYRWIYAAQGFGTFTMAMFNPDSGSWTPSSDTRTGSGLPTTIPFFLGNSGSGLLDRNPVGVVVPKEFSGYEYDRIYVFRGGNRDELFSRALDNDGYYKEGAPWIIHAETPETQDYGYKAFIYEGAIYLAHGSGSSDLSKFELPANPEDTGSWVEMSGYLPQTFGNNRGPVLDLHNHLCNKVHVREFETNTYWFFADLDRVVVVVKDSNSSYSYMYTGLFVPFADDRVTTLKQAAAAGASNIKVNNPDLFSIGKKYMLVDNTGAYEEITSEFSGTSKRLAPSELVTVLDILGDELLITSTVRAYSANSLIGEDPMPLMVRVHDIERAQTLNHINLVDGEEDYTDPAWQRYFLTPTVTDSFANTVDNEERSQNQFLHGIVLVDEGDSFSGKEVRGQLKDVYAGGTGLANESEIDIGSDTYIVFDIDNSSQSQRIIVGPK